MKKFLDACNRAATENPIVFLGVAAAFVGSSAKFIDAVGRVRGSNAYAKQVNHRVKRK